MSKTIERMRTEAGQRADRLCVQLQTAKNAVAKAHGYCDWNHACRVHKVTEVIITEHKKMGPKPPRHPHIRE